MSNRSIINEAIFSAIDALNEQYDDTELAKSSETALYGEGSEIDSLRLVALILSTEAEISDRLGVTLTLASEKAFSYKNSPFASVGTLGDYIETLLAEAEHVPS